MEQIAIASDHAGYECKEQVKEAFAAQLAHMGAEWLDLGANGPESVNYADFGLALGRTIAEGRAARGIVICGTGIGISIAVNRYAQVRAALCANATMARLARQHNDANVLALGSRIIGFELMRDCVDTFLTTPFEGGRHQARVDALAKGL